MSAWWGARGWIARRRRRGAPPAAPPDAAADEPAVDLATIVARVEAASAEEHAGEGPVLRVRGARLNLGGVQALDGASLDVAPGTVHALIGPNGSGKTTLLNVLSGFAVADEGTVEVAGRDVGSAAADRRVALGIARTFQTPYVFGGVSCAENVLVALDHGRRVGFFGYLVRLPRARAEERRNYATACEVLRAVGLGHRVDHDAAALPPGERRLLELARILALRPRAVLMDEPAGGLNPTEIRGLERFVHELRRQGVAVLLVEHHMDLVMRLADRVTVLNLGRDIADGTPDEVRRDPAVLAGYLGDEVVASTEEAPA
jgi:ABC-type branched-subunit amino acid transport system ATPase component